MAAGLGCWLTNLFDQSWIAIKSKLRLHFCGSLNEVAKVVQQLAFPVELFSNDKPSRWNRKIIYDSHRLGSFQETCLPSMSAMKFYDFSSWNRKTVPKCLRRNNWRLFFFADDELNYPEPDNYLEEIQAPAEKWVFVLMFHSERVLCRRFLCRSHKHRTRKFMF